MILEGQEAADHIRDTWQDLGQGMVHAHLMNPWLVMRRESRDYVAYISCVNDEIVVITDDDIAIDADLDERYDEQLDSETHEMIGHALESEGGGMYPYEGVFCVNYVEDKEHKQLRIGLLDDTVKVVES